MQAATQAATHLARKAAEAVTGSSPPRVTKQRTEGVVMDEASQDKFEDAIDEANGGTGGGRAGGNGKGKGGGKEVHAADDDDDEEEFDEEMDDKTMRNRMMKLMIGMSKDMKQVKRDVSQSKVTADMALHQAEQACTAARAVQQDMATLQTEVKEMKEGGLKEIVKQVLQEESGGLGGSMSKSTMGWNKGKGKGGGSGGSGLGGKETQVEEEDNPMDREIVIKRFGDFIKSQAIIDHINSIIERAQVDAPEKVYTKKKMGGNGFVRFRTIEQKRKFKDWWIALGGEEEEKSPEYEGCRLKMSNNEPYDVRVKGRAMAKVRKALYEKKEGRKDITFDRITGEVFVDNKRVAAWDEATAKPKLRGEAKEVEERIWALIAEKHKRDELSE